MPKHFMRIRDLGHSGAWEIIRRAKEMKETNYRGHCMDGKVAALIFEKASTRTRVSFDVAVRQLGGTTIFMTPAESQLGRSEPLRDTARVLSRYVDCLIVRTFGQEKLDELAEYGSLPVVNALTDQGHPCQLMADLLTIYERTPDFSKVTVTWVGDGNNMANSLIVGGLKVGMEVAVACPEGYDPHPDVLAFAREGTDGRLVTVVNTDRAEQRLSLPWSGDTATDLLTGQEFFPEEGTLTLCIPPRGGFLLG